MDWHNGYIALYSMAIVDPATWLDIETVQITGGSVKREPSGLRESADINCTGIQVSVERWVRIYLEARQGDSSERKALFTGLASAPNTDIDGNIREQALECYSVLKPADDVLLPRGWYAGAGRVGSDIVRELLAATPAPVKIAGGSPKLSANIIAEDGETNLTMIDRVLTAINWRLRIDGDGTIEVLPKASGAVASLDPLEADIIEPEISVTADWYACPNVLMAIDEDLTAIARDDGDGPLSTATRGREVWAIEDGCDLSAGETLAEYAQRRLKEAQTVAKSATYNRRYLPDVTVGDMIMLHYPEQGLDGAYIVESQSIDLGHGARTAEEVKEHIE